MMQSPVLVGPEGCRSSTASGLQSGQALPLVVLVSLMVVVLVAGSVRLGRDARDRAVARSAADAAALAGASGGRPAALEIAGDNDARLLSYRSAGADVEVTVQVGRAEATARARQLGAVAHHGRNVRGSLP